MEQTKIKKRTINLLSTPVIRDENIISLGIIKKKSVIEIEYM